MIVWRTRVKERTTVPAIPADGAPPTEAPAHLQVSRLMDGYLATQLLYVAAKLGVADALAGGPQTAERWLAA